MFLWISLVCGVNILTAYIWAGKYVLNTGKVQRFLVTLWIIFMLLSVFYLVSIILILLKLEPSDTYSMTMIVIFRVSGTLYSVGHWIFSF